MHTYEYLVVGKGLIGAAALRYLSHVSGDVAAIGPDEPADTGTHQGVFSSHYDQGRITTQLSRDRTWAELTRRAMARYAYLEEAGGARFYHPVGMLHAAPEGDASLQATAELARSMGVDHAHLTSTAIAARLPHLRLPSGFQCMLEEAPAGIINPRSLIHDQLTIARSNGAQVFGETVIAARRTPHHWRLTTDRGHHYTAKKVLLSVGAYSNCFDLWTHELDLRIKSETTILVQVSTAESRRLRGMPAIGYRIDSPSISDVYVVPPLLYPDGNHYIKLGANTVADSILPTFDEIQRWMKSGCDQPRRDMQEALFDLLPDLDFISVRVKRCLVTYSAHGKPYVDVLDDGLFVATAGNGSGAACSDTLGCMAADLMLDRAWPTEFARGDFERRFMAPSPNRPSQ
jgi:glycine/D-amino acid oxidase-like deaminating enzyme